MIYLLRYRDEKLGPSKKEVIEPLDIFIVEPVERVKQLESRLYYYLFAFFETCPL